jgi:peroxiredoxin/uncharacterized membrane protein YphA (DoxX/SURF4 family)
MDTAVLGVRIALAAIFALASAGKLLDREGSRQALAGFGVPPALSGPGGVLLPVAELAVAVGLVLASTAQIAAAAGLVLLLGFIGGITNALARGRTPDCHCFGQIHSSPAGWGTVARNAVLAAAAGFVVVEGSGPALDSWIGERSDLEIVAVSSGIAILALAAAALRLWSDNRRLRRDLAAGGGAVGPARQGLPVGEQAPGFSLSGLRGETLTLDSIRSAGRPIALVFVDPGCGPCKTLLPDIGRWQSTLASSLSIVLVSRGKVEENLPASEEHGIADVLLQEDNEVAQAYGVAGTPSAVIVGADGRIASAAAAGSPTIEALIRLTLRRSGSPLQLHPSAAEPPA